MKRIALLTVFVAMWIICYGQGTIRVMSYNIRYSNAYDGEYAWDNRRDATVRMIGEERPMVVGMQELCADQEAFLDSALSGYRHIGVGRDDGRRGGEMMAVFYDTSLVEVAQWGTFWLSESPDVPSKGWDAACTRTCTWAVMKEKGGGLFLFYNTHLDHVGKQAREMEVRLIADSIKAMSVRMGIDRVFLTGDFNTSTASGIFKPLKEVMGEARASSPVTDRGYTYNGFGKVDPQQEDHVLDGNGNSDNAVAIDHIFYMGVQPLEFRVLRGDYGAKYMSDHFPVVSLFATR